MASLSSERSASRMEGALQDLRELLEEVERKAPAAHANDVWDVAVKLEQAYGALSALLPLLEPPTPDEQEDV